MFVYMLAIRLDREVELRLETLAKKTGRTKTYYAREAILEHLGDMEDYYLAVEAIQNPGKLYTAEEAKRDVCRNGARSRASQRHL